MEIEQILQSEVKRRENSNEVLKEYIEQYFAELDKEIGQGFAKYQEHTD